MLNDKENATPMDSSASSSVRSANYNSNSIGGGLALDLQAPRIIRFGENDYDIFHLKEEDSARAMLVDKLKADPTSPDKWLELFRAPPSYEPKAFSVLRLFRRAMGLMDKAKSRPMKSYTEIWIRWAHSQLTEKETRDAFKYMKSDRIGERERMFYEHYAAFEYAKDNHLEADEILSLGVRNGVFSSSEKDAMYQRLAQGHMPVLPSSAAEAAAEATRASTNSVSRHLQTPRDQRTSAARLYSTPGGDSTTTSSMFHTPVAPTPSTGFATARKADLMTTPSMPTRLPTSAQTTSRKTTPTSRFFNLGGPPLRVIASTGPTDDAKTATTLDEEEDDSDDMGMKDEAPKRSARPLSPIRETATEKRSLAAASSTTTAGRQAAPAPDRSHTGAASSVPPSASKPGSASLDYIKKWAPRPISSMSSSARAPSFDHNNTDLYPSPKRRNLGALAENGDRGASGKQIRLDPHSPASVGSASSSSSPLSSTDSSAAQDPFAALSSKVVVNGAMYIKLEQIGSGGSSKVYRMLGPDLKIYALKKIKLKRLDPSSIEQYTNEIQLLQRLQGNQYIIKLIAAEQDMAQRAIHVLMEHGEIDLGERLREMKDGLDENFLRVIWTQMLQAVHAIHTERIIHGDLKPANFLFVNGALKLIDFGIAKAISNDTTNIERDSQVGTVNFMSPEAIQGNAGPGGQRNPQGKMKVGRASDIWSLGCILYQIVYGKPPFADLNSIIEKFRCIIDPSYPIPFPPLKNTDLEDVIRKCLQRDHRARPTIDGPNGLLSHPFLRNSTSASTLSVTKENGPDVLHQMADLLRTQGVESSKVARFVEIGEEGLRGSSSSSGPHRINPTRGVYKYDTQERRTDI